MDPHEEAKFEMVVAGIGDLDEMIGQRDWYRECWEGACRRIAELEEIIATPPIWAGTWVYCPSCDTLVRPDNPRHRGGCPSQP